MEDDTNSDGLQQVKYATTVDTRRAITYGANYITKTISVGQRFMIKNKDVYKVTNISDFEYNGIFTGSDGIITASMSEVLLEENDDKENNLANNDNKNYIKEVDESGIYGDNFIYIGAKNKYECAIEKLTNIEWEVECTEGLIILQSDDRSCTLKCKLDINFIGEEVKLYIVDKDTNSRYMKKIKVRGL